MNIEIMSAKDWQELSRQLCKRYDYYRVGGFDTDTKTAWACEEKGGRMFHIDYQTGQRIYEHSYPYVSLFQEGLACVATRSPGFCTHHIGLDGQPAYRERHQSVCGFSESMACTKDSRGCFHLKKSGRQAYTHRFKTVGRFCFGLAQAETETGCFHIKPNGKPAYNGLFLSCGPFNENGLAWVEYIKQDSKTGKKLKVRRDINTKGVIQNQ